MKTFKLISLIAFTFLLACSDDDAIEITPTCSDGIQNGDETGIDCGGSCSPCVEPCTDFEVSFAETGRYGVNILRDINSEIDTLVVTGFTDLSLEASTVASCTELKVTIKNLTADCQGCWAIEFLEFNEWDISDYNFSNNSQTFTSIDTEMDMRLYGFTGGVYQIDYYVNDSLTHTNYLQSVEDELEVFIEGAFAYSVEDGGENTYITSLDALGTGTADYYGTIDLSNPSEGVTNQFVSNSITQAVVAANEDFYYYDFEAREIKKLNLLDSNPSGETVISSTRRVVDLAFKDDILYLIVLHTDEKYYVATADLAMASPTIEFISEGYESGLDFMEINNNTLYVGSFFGDLLIIDLSNENYSSTFKEQFFSDGGFTVVRAMDVNNTHVYYATDGKINRINLETEEKEVMVQTNPADWFYGVHLEEEFLIYSEPLSQTIYKKDL